MHRILSATAVALSFVVAACGNSSVPVGTGAAPSATPRAVCGPGSRPETDLQGRVTGEDYDSGRAAAGFSCNTELVGQHSKTDAAVSVAGFKVERYVDAAGHECAYYDSTRLFPESVLAGELGVNVLDMSNPAEPVRTARLLTPAMLSPHESLVLSKERGLLAAVLGNIVFGPGVVDLYDLTADCRNPVLKSSLPVGVLGHESGMAPDGRTFYSASNAAPTLTAVDISNPVLPLPLAITPIYSHGLSISADGNRAYVAGGSTTPEDFIGGGQDYPALIILDVSEVQARKPFPKIREISRLKWDNITIPQNAIPITIKGHPYLVEVDEFATNGKSKLPAGNGIRVGAARIIDIGDETKPKVISDLRLEVHQPENRPVVADDPGARQFVGGYAGHYCNVPTRVDPKIVACSMLLSGLRVFDIRDPYHPREVAYFNAPVSTRPGSVNSAVSSPSFVPERKEIWYTDLTTGFYAVRVTNGAWPD
ncbi:hypothetical protein D0B54_22845 [Solimonas sp. K1W22B-7]|uniref:LVIVD repeat-containing protein n=1 Tax=Solimonas sp. K1W22B-7 TaxID=2303331 RepID=UPI000E331428|nr:hypothetical protein [Solimonas sp. K1W22B-7]AXQ31347.1 hypothetical protein D0B54_22845 [Solimonas sp. K1W22B-7]